MKVFSVEWFNHSQIRLLKFANTKFGKLILGIPFNHKVIHLHPSCYSHIVGYNPSYGLMCELRSRTENIYAKRLRERLSPLWWTMHFADWIALDRFKPLPSFGFATLSEESDSGGTDDPWNVSMYKSYGSGTNWSTIRGDTSATSKSSNPTNLNVGINFMGSDTTKIDLMYRSNMGYDTSIIKPWMPILPTSSYFELIHTSTLLNPIGDTSYLNSGWSTYWSDNTLLDIGMCKMTPSTTSPSVNDWNITRYDTSQRIATKLYSACSGAPTENKYYMDSDVAFSDLVHGVHNYYSYFGLLVEGDRRNVDPVQYNTGGPLPGTDLGYSINGYAHASYPGGIELVIIYTDDTIKVNIGDSWKTVNDIKVHISGAWKSLASININISDVWKGFE